MGVFGRTMPNGDAKMLLDAEAMLKEARAFGKALGGFSSAVKKFEGASDTLITASQGVLSNGTTTNKPLIDQLRGSLKTQLNANVHGQIRDYKTLLKRVSADFKVLSKKCDTYGQAEASLQKVNVAKTKAEQSGAPETKQLKIQNTYQVKNTAYETAKSAFLGSAPQVLKDCELLINKRDQLRVSLFSAFAVSAETLNKVANLKPKSSFEAPNTLSKA